MNINATINADGHQFRFSTGEESKKTATLVKNLVQVKIQRLSKLSVNEQHARYAILKDLPLLDIEDKVELRYLDKVLTIAEPKKMSLDKSVDIFQELFWEAGKPTDSQVNDTLSIIGDFLFYLKKEKKILYIEELSEELARTYFTHLRDNGTYSKVNRKTKERTEATKSVISRYTYNEKLGLIKRFYSILRKSYPNCGLITIPKLKRDNNDKNRKTAFTDEELDVIEKNFDKMTPCLQHAFTIATNTGLRLADCFNFGAGHIYEWEGMRVLKVIAQKNRHHEKVDPLEVPICDKLWDYLMAHGNVTGPYFFPESRELHFKPLDERGQQTYRNTNSIDFGDFLDAVEIKRNVKTIRSSKVTLRSFHSTRHTFARRMVEKGIDINTLTIIMGHDSIEMNLLYSKHVTKKGFKDTLKILN